VVVEVENLWKTFQIPHEKRTTLFENLTGLLRPDRYTTLTVLRDISFKVEEGECIGIIGDNGSGKSTLLKIIANILRPTQGRVAISGKIIPFLELGLGFQPDLTVRENVDVYASIMGLSSREIKDIIEEAIEFAELRRFEDAKLKNLSSGMQVRLAFSTAIQTDPDILLVDEILAVGDMEFQQKCFDVFERYRKEGVTILFVSHDLRAVRRFCDKTLLLAEGRQITFGDTNRVIDKYIYNSDARDEAAEAAAADAGGEEAGSAEEEIRTRWGDKRIEITDVKFIDKNGNYNDNFISNDPVRVRIFYHSHERMLSPVFGIIFYHKETYCYGTTSEFKGVDTGLLYGSGHVDLIMERLPFLEGRFDVTVAVGSPDYKTNYDWHDRLYSFNVQSPGRELGIFSIDCGWCVKKHD
jgi:lipopolysaccharide transport system ATP-binding protein